MYQEVKYFSSTMPGAPVVNGNWGDLVGLLDAVLVSGFNLKTVESIRSENGLVTAAVSSGHGYQVNQVVLISGCEQAEYNGEHLITSTTSSTFSYKISSTPASPATTQSTISAKVAPLGFQTVFTANGKRAYRSASSKSLKPFLRVDDSVDPVWDKKFAKYAKVTIAEGMTDIDTFSGARGPYDPAYPTKNEIGYKDGGSIFNGWYKWIYDHLDGGTKLEIPAGAGARVWAVVGDDRGFFLNISPDPTTPKLRQTYYFGDIKSYKLGDAFPWALIASDLPDASNSYVYIGGGNFFPTTLNMQGKTMVKDYTQVGGTTRFGFFTLNPVNQEMSSGADNYIPWPNGPDFSLQLWPVWIKEEAGHIRGEMPGYFFLPQNLPFNDFEIIDNVISYQDRKFILLNGATSNNVSNKDWCRLAFDITGPWR